MLSAFGLCIVAVGPKVMRCGTVQQRKSLEEVHGVKPSLQENPCTSPLLSACRCTPPMCHGWASQCWVRRTRAAAPGHQGHKRRGM